MADEAPVTEQTKLNCRWRKGAVRYDTKRTVEQTRFVRQADGSRRRETDAPTEVKFCERVHEQAGWRNGARIRKLEKRND
jgi:hypothetical protein